MGELQFENQGDEFGPPPAPKPKTDWTGKLVEMGIVANREQATYVVFGLLILILVATYIAYRTL